MRRYWTDMNPTLRGFLIIALIALVVVVLQLYQTLVAIGMLLRIAFFLAIAFVLYLLWRDRMRHDIETWSARAKWAFYAAGALILVELGLYFSGRGPALAGLDAIAFLAVIAMSAFSMWRIWRDQRSYS